MDGRPDLILSASVKALRATLAAASKVAGQSPVPILGCVMFRRATVSAVSPDLSLCLSVDVADCAASGFAVLELRSLKRCLAKRKPGDRVDISAYGDRAVVNVAGHRFTLPCFGLDEWPDPASPRNPSLTEIPAGELAGALADVTAAISTEETRYYLNGALFTRSPAGMLTLVATDGHRLHKRETAVAFGEEHEAIMPRAAVHALNHVLKGAGDEAVTIASGRDVWGFAGLGWTVIATPIDAVYPDWQRVIPRAENAVMAESAALATAAASCDSSMVIEFGKGRVIDTGAEWGFECPVRFDGDAGTERVRLNARYLGQILERCNGTVAFGLSSDGAPVLLASPERPEFLAALMPMRL